MSGSSERMTLRSRSGSLSSNESTPQKPSKKKTKQIQQQQQTYYGSPATRSRFPTNNKKFSGNDHRNTLIRKRNESKFPKESEILAIDCEMVGLGKGGEISSAARVTVINWFGDILLDEHIRQTEPVADYRTFVSGITEKDLDEATMTLEECRKRVLQLFQNRILVGHALKNDFKALGITHPWYMIRDTAKYKPFMKDRLDDGILSPRKLKDLAKEKIHQDIQVSGKPHSPYEDALAALNLYRSVRPKWETIMLYKIEKTSQIQQQAAQ